MRRKRLHTHPNGLFDYYMWNGSESLSHIRTHKARSHSMRSMHNRDYSRKCARKMVFVFRTAAHSRKVWSCDAALVCVFILVACVVSNMVLLWCIEGAYIAMMVFSQSGVPCITIYACVSASGIYIYYTSAAPKPPAAFTHQ